MIDLLRELFPLRLAPASDGLDRAVEILCRELPFEIHEYASGREHNGWVVPPKWEVHRAEIWRDGALVHDGLANPLGVISLSEPFSGRVPLEELRRHLLSHPTLRHALVYHCDLLYKPWRADWGFTMAHEDVERLEPGDYDVVLETSHTPGTMKVCTFHLPGSSEETIVLNAHDCHPGQANDDIAGVVVGVEVMRRLRERENRFSYRLVIAPEHLGTVFYLADLPADDRRRLKYGAFLEMLGTDGRIGLQETFGGDTLIDRAAWDVLSRTPGAERFAFRKLVGNDETVWEAPGIEVPCISIARYPYAEYHSSDDTDAIISEDRLVEAADAVTRILEIIESDCTMHRRFDGLVALGNPRYDLYIATFDPSLGVSVSAQQRDWNYLMDCLPRYFDGETTVLDVAERHGLPFHDVLAYVRRFEEKRLITLEAAYHA